MNIQKENVSEVKRIGEQKEGVVRPVLVQLLRNHKK